MKRATTPAITPRRLLLRLETLRLISGGEVEPAAGPRPTQSSTASTCQSSKFACC